MHVKFDSYILLGKGTKILVYRLLRAPLNNSGLFVVATVKTFLLRGLTPVSKICDILCWF